MTCWAILEIEPTESTRDIKRAYARILKEIDPEQDPVGFQRLNEAYKAALDFYRYSNTHNTAPASDTQSNSLASKPHQNDLDEDTSIDTLNLNNEQALVNEINKQQQASSLEQEQYNKHVAAFRERLREILLDPKLRDKQNAWNDILNDPEIDSYEFRQDTSLSVFAAFVDHFNAELVNVDGVYVPHPILREIADRYSWDTHELELADYFSPNDINRVLTYAYAKHPIIARPSKSEKPVSLLKVFLLMFIIIVLLALLFNGFNKSKQAVQAEIQVAPKVQWDERLLSCNNVFSGEPSEDFKTCLTLADAGNLDALKRITWAYSRPGKFSNKQGVLDNLKKLRLRDREAYLLYFVFMKDHSNNEKNALEGEIGIKRLANKNYPPANVFLAVLYALKQNTLEQTSNILWLLERAYENDQRVISPPNLATIYSNGLLGKKDYKQAFSILYEAADNNYPFETNNVAWYLATLDNNPLSEPEYALSLALRVVADPVHGKRHTYVDTLAAAYAANGDFDKAVKTQEQAIALIDELKLKQSIKDQEVADFKTRLDLYNNEQRLIEYSFAVDKTDFFVTLKNELINQIINGFYVTFEAPPPPVIETTKE